METFYEDPSSREEILQSSQAQNTHTPHDQPQQQHHEPQPVHNQLISLSGTPTPGPTPPMTDPPIPAFQADTSMFGGESLDDIIRDNYELHRRRSSVPQSFHSPLVQGAPTRRLSVMEFSSSSVGLSGYPFADHSLPAEYQNIGSSLVIPEQMPNFAPPHQPVMSMTGTPTDYTSLPPDIMGNMMPNNFANMNMGGTMGQNASPMGLFPAQYGPVGLPGSGLVGGFDMGLGVDAANPSPAATVKEQEDTIMSVAPAHTKAGMASHPAPVPALDKGVVAFSAQSLPPPAPPIPAARNPPVGALTPLPPPIPAPLEPRTAVSRTASRTASSHTASRTASRTASHATPHAAAPAAATHAASRTASHAPSHMTSHPAPRTASHTTSHPAPHAVPYAAPPHVTPQTVPPHAASHTAPRVDPHTDSPTIPDTVSTETSGPVVLGPLRPSVPAAPQSRSIYSKSGFDCVMALSLVSTRKTPEINLGVVDLSCAFVICDITMNDCPIVYVSPNFQNLTGYSSHEIIGKNCRFLQAPDGKVEAGTRREFVDDSAVYNLKQKIAQGREVQQSLINYRKGGKPFLNLLTMIPIPWNSEELRYFVGFQIDIVETPEALSSDQDEEGMMVNYKPGEMSQYIWTPPQTSRWDPDNGQTLGVDEVSTLLQQFRPKGASLSDWHRQSWDKMLLENADDVVHVVTLKGVFLYLSPACKRVLEYDASELVGTQITDLCNPSDQTSVMRDLKDATAANPVVNMAFRIRRKSSGFMWFESHGSLFIEPGKGRKFVILIGRQRPVFALSRQSLEGHGGVGDCDMWAKMSTSGMFLYVSSNIRSLLDFPPDALVGTSIQDMMRRESRPEFGRSVEKARRGKVVSCKHEVQNRRGQVLQAQTVLYPGDTVDGKKPSFLIAQIRLLKASLARVVMPATQSAAVQVADAHPLDSQETTAAATAEAGRSVAMHDAIKKSTDNVFEELGVTRPSSWQYELRQMEKINRILAEELGGLLSNRKKRKRRKGLGNVSRDCANCHTRSTPEWRRGPSGQRDLCNSCGLRWAKQTGRVSPRNSARGGCGDSPSKNSNSPNHASPLQRETPVMGPQASGILATDAMSGQDSSTSSSRSGLSIPPPSQPLLEGGSGVEMTSITEERETAHL